MKDFPKNLKIIGLGLAFLFALSFCLAFFAILMIKAPWMLAGVVLLGVSYLFGVFIHELIYE